MEWFFIEALVALLALVGIVAWTMLPRRHGKATGERSRGPEELR